MKRLTTFLLAALALMAVAIPCTAQVNPLMPEIPGCTVVRIGPFVTISADTLWFTKAAPNPNAALFTAQKADWLKPTLIAVGSDRNGNVQTETRRVKTVKLFSRQPFSFLAFYPSASAQDGVLSPSTVYCLVDSVSRGNASTSRLDKYPCIAYVPGFPDSIRIKEAGTDTVKTALGY